MLILRPIEPAVSRMLGYVQRGATQRVQARTGHPGTRTWLSTPSPEQPQ